MIKRINQVLYSLFNIKEDETTALLKKKEKIRTNVDSFFKSIKKPYQLDKMEMINCFEQLPKQLQEDCLFDRELRIYFEAKYKSEKFFKVEDINNAES